jgi:hypothetical protein
MKMPYNDHKSFQITEFYAKGESTPKNASKNTVADSSETLKNN